MNVRSSHEATKGMGSVNAVVVALTPPYYSHSYVVTVQPTEFEIGQLVELQVAVAAVPLTKGGFQILNKLRSICLLDRVVVTVSTCLPRVLQSLILIQETIKNNILGIIQRPLGSAQAVKRKVGYNDENEEQVETTRIDLKRVHLHSGGSHDTSSD